MLRKIDCVMVRVPDLTAATTFYTEVFGLRPLWRDAESVGMGMAETDAEVVLHTMDLHVDCAVYYLVDDVPEAVATAQRAGCAVRQTPFEVAIGQCAVLEDLFGNVVGLLDLSNGPRARWRFSESSAPPDNSDETPTYATTLTYGAPQANDTAQANSTAQANGTALS